MAVLLPEPNKLCFLVWQTRVKNTIMCCKLFNPACIDSGCYRAVTSHVWQVFTLTANMKIYSISVVLAPPSGASVVLSNASDLSSFSFYQRGSAGEFMTFLSKTVAERTPQGQRQTVQEQSHVAHVYNRGGAEQLAGKPIFVSMFYY